MAKPFEVKAVKAGRFQAVSFSLDSTRPEEYFHSLESTLSRMKVDGDVLLDLLACNGQTTRRFFAVHFDGRKLLFHTMRVERAPLLDPALLDICGSFYAKNKSKLSNSVLSSMAIQKLGSTAH
ncbi:type II toxin-antitoxin system RnlB family antitoxin [Aquabacterium sp.]|uniref:type II toxin-antitoxin system RnlB family antitoxin n=1 Tax=Aquabacterium sp. TaxID=1872578 RepID=UPI002E306DE9|nr:type II toxin-antitoxin system RnlB family antitoxin [Aquabacterium sp.]HEX5312666.1 type II toxin-antitoxin system RnlB family antitoxin [Aquabacterium sp.]